jgi:hypothetical protein
MRYPISLRLLFLWWAFFGASSPVVCQVVAKFHADHDEVHYTTYLAVDQLNSTPEWRDYEPNPPLDVRQAMTAASEGLKQLFDNADEWKLDAVTLKPMRDRWIYVVGFVAPSLQSPWRGYAGALSDAKVMAWIENVRGRRSAIARTCCTR